MQQYHVYLKSDGGNREVYQTMAASRSEAIKLACNALLAPQSAVYHVKQVTH